MVYNELCHKEIDWSKAMKQLLITLVAVVLGSTATNIMSDTTDSRVMKIVSEQLGVSVQDVTGTSSFVDDLGADSLDTVELVMALEEEFSIEIPDDEAEQITTVQQAVDYINSAK